MTPTIQPSQGTCNQKQHRTGRTLYLFQAAFEYLITILVSGPFLATLTASLGISDSLTGILSAFLGLGGLFQILSIFLFSGGSVKRPVLVLSIINQLLFLLLYVVPLMPGKGRLGTALFTLFILLAFGLYNLVNAPKINWLMSHVDNHSRGVFTARKEMISLAAGMLFSLGMGAMIDHYREAGQLRIAFVLATVVIFVLMLAHTATLVFIAEEAPQTSPQAEDISANPQAFHPMPVAKPAQRLRQLFVLPAVRKMIFLVVLWTMANNVAIPFYGTYQIKELGFSLTFISMLSIGYSVTRMAVSRMWGALADRTSFAWMTRVCLLVAGAGFVFGIFTVPANGRIFYSLFYLCNAVAMGGLSSAMINLVFDETPPALRRDALALSQGVGGVCGFITTATASLLVNAIQQNANRLFGVKMYAQQAVSVLALLLTLVCVWYIGRLIRQKQPSDPAEIPSDEG